MGAVAARVARADGWRRWALAWLLGAIAAGAMPPFSVSPLLLISFSGLVWLLDGCGGWRGAARDGWWFGFGFLVAGLYWISNALLVDAARFGWLVPFAVLGLPAFLAIFSAAGTALARTMWVPGPMRVVALAAGWTVAEAARGHWFTGFPWNLAGYTFAWSLPLLQASSVIGVYGLSLVVVGAAASPAALAEPGASARHPRAVWAPVLAAVMIAVLGLGGWARLQQTPPDTVPGVLLRLVQGNIAQQGKWDPNEREANLQSLLALSQAPGAVTHILWAETAATFFLDHQPRALAQLAAIVPAGGALVTGAPRVEVDANGGITRAVGADGAIAATYDKAHLVPFGEYIPVRRILGAIGLDTIVPGSLDYAAGPGPRTLALPGLPPVSPLICYEAIFPGGVVERGARPGWLLNATNDAWYGRSSGPYQHFEMARLRAVEQGLPLVRVANTGISAVIDPFGRVPGRMPLGRAGVLDAPLPAALPPTVYARFGFWIPGAMLLAAYMWLLVARGRVNR